MPFPLNCRTKPNTTRRKTHARPAQICRNPRTPSAYHHIVVADHHVVNPNLGPPSRDVRPQVPVSEI
jgi:hypothetical protein